MISIVDYGLGNIKAFSNVYKRLNIPCSYASTIDDVKNASRLILPGVGSFDHAMTMLNRSGLREALEYQVVENRVPVIGICVGMQMMANSSDEGRCEGLGWIPGHVRRFTQASADNKHVLPLPHMGWNSIDVVKRNELTQGLNDSRRFYFLHSYYFDAANENHVLAKSNYGCDYASVVNRDNVFGIQCHPEKSHSNGVILLKNFASANIC